MPRLKHRTLQEQMALSNDQAWCKGFACAVAEILRTHEDEVIAKDVLRTNQSALLHADPEDLEILKKHGLAP